MQFYTKAMFVIILTPILGNGSVFEQVVPRPDRCWYVNSDGSELGFAVIKNLQRSAYTLVNWKEMFSDNISLLNCDGHILIRENIEKVKCLFASNDWMELNKTITVDTRVILIYQGKNEIKDDYFEEFLKRVMFNVVLLRVPQGERKHAGFFDYNISEMHASAPLSRQRSMFKRNNSASRENVGMSPELEGLFRSQRWDPVKRDATLLILIELNFDRNPFYKCNYDEQLDGVEQRIIQGITKDWNIWYSCYTGDSVGFCYCVHDLLTFPCNSFVEPLEKEEEKADVLLSRYYTDTIVKMKHVVYMYESACQILLVPKPKMLTTHSAMYLSLSTTVWFCFIVIFVAVTALIFIIARFYLHSTDNSDNRFRQFSFCIINFFRAVIGQATFLPKSRVLKIILLSWMIVCMLVITAYSTGYSSNLMKQKYTAKIRTLEMMIDALDSDIYWNSQNMELVRCQLANLVNNSYNTSSSFRCDVDRWRCVNRILQHKYYLDEIDEHYLDLLEPLEECLKSNFLTINISPRSPFIRKLQERLYAASETGLIMHWIDQVMRRNKIFFVKKTNKEEHRRALNLKDIKGAFRLLIAGLSLAGFCFILEWFSKR